MKQHQFIPNEFVGKTTHDICQGCGLPWNIIHMQVWEENGLVNRTADEITELTFDDCDKRKRLQSLKAFW